MAAVVHDPGARETFTAVRGAGAALNGQPIRASGCARLAEAIVGFSLNPSPQAKRDMAQIMSALLQAVGDIRRVPAALHLAYLAAGRFNAGLLWHTKLWDIAAGLLVAAEAGVVLSGPDGAPAPSAPWPRRRRCGPSSPRSRRPPSLVQLIDSSARRASQPAVDDVVVEPVGVAETVRPRC